MQRKISWALLGTLVLISSVWYIQAQWNYQKLIQLARGLALQLTDAALEELPQAVRVRFTLVLNNTGAQAITVEGVSCLLTAGREFLGPCVISDGVPSVVPAYTTWRLIVITDITGYYRENYLKAQAEGVRVRGSLQIELPLGDNPVTITRRFDEFIPKL